MFGWLDLTEHQLTTIGTWAEVAILLFMVWEAYGPSLRGGAMTATAPAHRAGLFGGLWENRTLVLAIIGLAIVAWLHFRESVPQPSANGFTREQVNDKIADATNALKSQLEEIQSLKAQLKEANEKPKQPAQPTRRQIDDAVAKATAELQGQIAQLQSDAPVSVDKLPTSLQLHFENNDIKEIASRNVIWTKVLGWREPNTLLSHSTPGWTIIIFFKKPITYKQVQYDDHGAHLYPVPEQTSDPHYEIIELNSIFVNGLLLDITFTNEQSK